MLDFGAGAPHVLFSIANHPSPKGETQSDKGQSINLIQYKVIVATARTRNLVHVSSI